MSTVISTTVGELAFYICCGLLVVFFFGSVGAAIAARAYLWRVQRKLRQ